LGAPEERSFHCVLLAKGLIEILVGEEVAMPDLHAVGAS
jgi:hypothetical protein